MVESAPSRLRNFPNRPQTCIDLWMFRRIAGQSSSDRRIICTKYFKESNPSKHSSSSSPLRLKVSPMQFSDISTSLLHHLIWLFLSHLVIRWCLMSRPSGMCIPHKLQQGRGSFLSWNTTFYDQKCWNMKCSCRLLALYANTGHPGTGHITNWSILGKDTI